MSITALMDTPFWVSYLSLPTNQDGITHFTNPSLVIWEMWLCIDASYVLNNRSGLTVKSVCMYIAILSMMYL